MSTLLCAFGFSTTRARDVASAHRQGAVRRRLGYTCQKWQLTPDFDHVANDRYDLGEVIRECDRCNLGASIDAPFELEYDTLVLRKHTLHRSRHMKGQHVAVGQASAHSRLSKRASPWHML